MSDKVYTIAFVPIDAFGHVNCCLGLATGIAKRGHKCVFITNQNWKQLIAKYEFEHKIYIEEDKLDMGKFWHDMIKAMGDTITYSSYDKINAMGSNAFGMVIDEIKRNHHKLKHILNDIKPDAIVVDSFYALPAVSTAGVPWIELCSSNPLYFVDDERLPPAESGYPINDKTKWKAYLDALIAAYSESWNNLNAFMVSEGAPPLEKRTKFVITSPYLNLNLYPEELCYWSSDELKKMNRYLIEALIREEKEEVKLEIPDKIKNGMGKLIYLSMGTVASADLKTIRRLISILSKSKNRFIISKGPLGNQIELPDNMWGQNSLPQLQILPLVDVFLTHGGNNSFTESLYFGKPMIILPSFGDQYDNAQRIVDLGIGIRIDPYFCSESELLEAIEKMANDSELTERYRQISERIQRSKSRENAVKLIEDVIENFKNNNKRFIQD